MNKSGRTSTPAKDDPSPAPMTNGVTKGQATRQRILAAAKRVFTRHPYEVASIRMIGKEGGFDYSLIHHYFASKADLMEAVAAEVYEEYIHRFGKWFEELDQFPTLRQALSEWLDRVLDYSFQNPAALKLIMQNISGTENLENTAGLRYFPMFNEQVQKGFREQYALPASEEEIGNWIYGISIFIANCVGAANYHSMVLGAYKKPELYRKRVKGVLMTLFLPGLKNLFRPR